MKKYLILDCYVDEPACFGVPPFISPYPRYIYGALILGGIDPSGIVYYTIDQLRDNDYILHDFFDIIFLIGGAVVPGKYLSGRIGTLSEIKKIIDLNKDQTFAIGGLISHVIQIKNSNVIIIKNDIEKFGYLYALHKPADAKRTAEEIATWSTHGAPVVKQHPDYPDIIAEIETSRGCPRENHCSFCSEGLLQSIEFREIRDIVNEVDALIDNGITRFRLGRQADILQYKTSFSTVKNSFPKPEISPIKELFSELRDRKSRGKIDILNIDNANPGTIFNFPDESSAILEAIVNSITPGDTLALGIESFDPIVIKKNNLKVSGEEAVEAVRIINQIGGKRIGGIPILLPGINLIHGLIGESMNTFEENYTWLLKMRDMNLLIKRINIRKLLPFPGTAVTNNKPLPSKKIINRFEYYRNKIRHDIENFMLKSIYPVGTIVQSNMNLKIDAGYSYGKQISSYSITVKIPLILELKKFFDAVVIGHRERSLIALPCPIPINTIPQKAIELIPGIGKKKTSEIIMQRPFARLDELNNFLQTVAEEITSKITLY